MVGPYLLGDAASHTDPANAYADPSASHLLGTDALGRDILARIVVATRLSLVLAFVATLITVTCGVFLGALPLFASRRVSRFLVGFVDFLVAFPGLLLALFLVVLFGTGVRGAVFAVGVAGVPFIARLTYTLALGIIERDYITASRMLGVRRTRVLLRHVIPNIAEPLLLNVAMQTGANLLAFAALSFLGLGVQPPSYDWGRLLNEGLERIYVSPAQALGTAFVVMVAGMTFSTVGEAFANVASGRSSSAGAARKRAGRAVVGTPSGRVETTASVVLSVDELRVVVRDHEGPVEAVRGVSFRIGAHESVGLVGESGSGKSLTAMAVANLLPVGAEVSGGRIELNGADPASLRPRERFAHLRRSVSVVLQDPMNSLNPVTRVGKQLAEVALLNGESRSAATTGAIARLATVRISAPRVRARQYPHEFSGGMRQRVMIAMGLMVTPRLIVADEPTTALDVTVQRQVLDLLDDVRRQEGTALLLITHDMGVVAERCDRVLVMYGGHIVEELPAHALAADAVHPYTRALLASVPDVSDSREGPMPTIPGLPPRLRSVPVGCPFAPRCEFADEQCHSERPPMVTYGQGQRAACWHPVLQPKPNNAREEELSR
ncbi:dipeptide/oligopeptide/nickel ABC transporter permease/ATP-binding protein [Dactylosporangium sp. CA-233914]|uniref:dipeptide/oligopeptide/nickel ABC transporter permease/ATP-binding protein n=1 Tax=Dactylosporangium sp. CA-233914 TaxID=3239934 RepID=UPI003D926BF8